MDASVRYCRRSLPCLSACCAVLACALITMLGGCISGKTGGSTKGGGSSVFSGNPFASKPPREVIDPEAGLEEFDAAVAKYEKKEYEEAIADFKALAKKYYDYPVEEDALFMIGECRFAQQRYAWAQDAYDGLIKKYPSTRYLEKSTRRLYAIGAIWLNGDGSPKTEELLQVSATDVTDPQAVKRKEMPVSIPLAPNFFDKSRPLFDTSGNALKALKSVWLHDPLGPLADDAVMLTAIYYIRKGNYREADHYMNILRQDYPKSEHTQTAFVVGSHIKLANYQGPRYDGRDLIEADDLIHSTINLFPNVEDKEGLKTELVKIRDWGAERYWSRAEYYRGRMKPQSEAIYCEIIVKEFPDSKIAEKARERLKNLGPKYWTGMLDQYADLQTPETGRGSRKAPAGMLPKINPKSPLTAPNPRKSDTDKPKSPAGGTQPRLPERKSPSPKPKVPTGTPSDSDNESDGDRPPARRSVDSPDFVEAPSDGSIEQISAEENVGRARP